MEVRFSSRCFIFNEDKILLIYRENKGEKYYAFPGGKVEENETDEQCILRECKEELGINVKVSKRVYEVIGSNFVQHFFLCDWIDGSLGTGYKEEYSVNRKGGLQLPMFVDINSLKKLNVVSKNIVAQLLTDYRKNGKNLSDCLIAIIDK